ncbi:hypothetical protein [Clostridium sp. DJ247]|uniref:hypothetical protein n=1 Tax=Clostridium sp. DJ247 TaxID=2726188 RepID=UPI00162529A8|nr:hypothetical protein [Clostridium sp. DJ247]MBC2580111.1 hypothetical protein [Clostridium sp. DJ247]
MISFKRMWDDVTVILSNNQVRDFEIVENFNSGFVIKDNNDTHFITKDDFVSFWCNMLCFNKVEKKQLIGDEKLRLNYVYHVIKSLPYINENEDTLNLTE